MADPRVFFDQETKRVVRTDPPELMDMIQPVKGTSFVIIPTALYDLDNGFRSVPVQTTVLRKKKPR